ncbi:MAG: type II secretion system protein, partial [Candidatus Eutrophobiaceae bacterium]
YRIARNRQEGSALGFTLLEMAISLLIIGALLGGLLVPYSTVLESQRRKQTQERLSEIQEVLYAHAVVKGRLPCPDCRAQSHGQCAAAGINDGAEDLSGQACATSVGNLPWADLGTLAQDAWKNPYTYRVDPAFARPVDACLDAAKCQCNAGVSAFTLCEVAALEIGDAPGRGNVGRGLPAVIVSHGRNFSHRGLSPSELENHDLPPFGGQGGGLPTHYVMQSPQYRSGYVVFDDMLTWLSPFVLKTRLLQAGKLP